MIEKHLDYADDIVVYQCEYNSGHVSREVLCAGLYISDEECRANHDAIKADMEKVNEELPDYKRIEYVELPDTRYEKTSTRKIKRTLLPSTCSGTGINLM